MFKERIALPASMLFLTGGLFFGSWYALEMYPELKGSIRPSLSVTSLRGTPTVLPSPFFGRHILLLFTPTCPHCSTALDHYSRLAHYLPHVAVYGISLGTLSATDSLLLGRKVPFPVLVDRDGSVRTLLGINRVPVTLFVDEEDVIRLVLEGARSFQEDSLLCTRFGRPGAPGASDVGSHEAKGIRMFPVAPPACMIDADVPTACLASGMSSCVDPVGPRSSIGLFGPADGPRQAAGSFNHVFISRSKKEDRLCVPNVHG